MVYGRLSIINPIKGVPRSSVPAHPFKGGRKIVQVGSINLLISIRSSKTKPSKIPSLMVGTHPHALCIG